MSAETDDNRPYRIMELLSGTVNGTVSHHGTVLVITNDLVPWARSVSGW